MTPPAPPPAPPPTLRQIVAGQTAAADELPLVHTTRSEILDLILQSNELRASECEVFHEHLLYFFYGRPAYRNSDHDRPIGGIELCPVCFVFRPYTIASRVKRVFACDSGGVHHHKFMPHLEQPDLPALELDSTIDSARKLVPLNAFHQIIIVAAALDDSTERIINYLNVRDIAISVVFFQVFQHGEEQLLSRVWLIDPGQTQTHAAATPAKQGEKEPWNGEYYVSCGSGSHHSWEDARKYGFICAGGGAWYSRTLKLLKPGDRVWIKDPGHGYVGVGEVSGTVVPVKEFIVSTSAGEKPDLEVSQAAAILKESADDSEKAEYFVPVKWLQAVNSLSEAFEEVGLFGNQNTVCQPTSPKWRPTVDRLKTVFKNWGSHAPMNQTAPNQFRQCGSISTATVSARTLRRFAPPNQMLVSRWVAIWRVLRWSSHSVTP